MDMAGKILEARRRLWAALRLVVQTQSQPGLAAALARVDELLASLDGAPTPTPPRPAGASPPVRPRGRPPKAKDRTIGTYEVARRLRTTAKWVYYHRNELPRVPGRGPLKFSARGIDTLQQERERAASAAPAVAAMASDAPAVLVAQAESGGEDGAGPLPDERPEARPEVGVV
jgi:hypothetical protein